MGKNGKEVLKNSLIDWSFEYTKKESVTSEDSFLLNIKNIKKRKMN
jgi:16S rRNA (guanine527-N7)-methyltransferase